MNTTRKHRLMEKLGSRLRKLVKVVKGDDGYFYMLFRGKKIGLAQVGGVGRYKSSPKNQLLGIQIFTPKERKHLNAAPIKGADGKEIDFQGMGLGKKFYGELARRTGGRLLSDAAVDPKAVRVWESFERRGLAKPSPWTKKGQTPYGETVFTRKREGDSGYTEPPKGVRRPHAVALTLPSKAVIK